MILKDHIPHSLRHNQKSSSKIQSVVSIAILRPEQKNAWDQFIQFCVEHFEDNVADHDDQTAEN